MQLASARGGPVPIYGAGWCTLSTSYAGTLYKGQFMDVVKRLEVRIELQCITYELKNRLITRVYNATARMSSPWAAIIMSRWYMWLNHKVLDIVLPYE